MSEVDDCGGAYRPGSGVESWDRQSTYLRHIFGLIGFTDIREIFVEPTEATPTSKGEAVAAANRVAAEMARSLRVWQEAMELAVAVYDLTKRFPRDEIYPGTSMLSACVFVVVSMTLVTRPPLAVSQPTATATAGLASTSCSLQWWVRSRAVGRCDEQSLLEIRTI